MIQIKRIAQSDQGTFGVMLMDGTPVLLTLELPWRANMPFVSCIPAGLYDCTKLVRPSNGEVTFKITNVPGRSDILFHKANTIDDLKGCVGIGRMFGLLNGNQAVLMSKQGQERFMEMVGDMKDFHLEISNNY
jgi:hypothetical protein